MSTPPDDRERRWIAHSLGELSEEESRELEEELKTDPERAARYRRLVGEVRQWAAEPTPHRPLDIARLMDEAAREGGDASGPSTPAGRSKPSRVPALAWTLAAAALLVFALSQARFTLQLGEHALHWGAGRGAEPNAEALSALRDQTDALLTQLDITRRRLQEVQWQNRRLEASFQQTAAWLSRQQQIESQTRFQDVKRLMQLTGLEDPTPALWIAQGGLGEEVSVKSTGTP